MRWFPGPGRYKYLVEIDMPGGLVKKVKFGDRRYEQYKDSTPLALYSNQNHGDKKRKDLYRKRASGIINKDGIQTYKIKYSPNWFAYHYLW